MASCSSYVKHELLNLKCISASTKNVLIAISTFPNGWFGSIKAMAENIARSTRTVQRALADLKTLNLIYQQYITLNDNRVLSYFVNWTTVTLLSNSQQSGCNKKGPCFHSPAQMNFKNRRHNISVAPIISHDSHIGDTCDNRTFTDYLKTSLFSKNSLLDSDIFSCLGGDKMSCHTTTKCRTYIYKELNTNNIYCVADFFYWVKRDEQDQINDVKIIGTINALAKELNTTIEKANAVADAVKKNIKISLFDLLNDCDVKASEQTVTKQQDTNTDCQFSSVVKIPLNYQVPHKANKDSSTTKLYKPKANKPTITVAEINVILTKHYHLKQDSIDGIAQEFIEHFTANGRNWRWGKRRITHDNLKEALYPWVKREKNGGVYLKYNRMEAEKPLFLAEGYTTNTSTVLNNTFDTTWQELSKGRVFGGISLNREFKSAGVVK